METKPIFPRGSSRSPIDLAAVYRINLPRDGDPAAALAELAGDAHVAYVQLDHEYVLDQVASPPVPFDDPFLSSSGSWGQPYADLWGLFQARVPEAWVRATGEGAIAAVVDTGLDATHPDIAANVWVNPGEDLDRDGRVGASDRNGIDDDANGFVDDLTGFDFANSVDANEDGDYGDPGDVSDADPDDDNGHGTHVAGTLAAVAGNGVGIAGVAPRARLMALKGFGANGSAPDSILWRAVLYAAENGAVVINNSWSCGTPCPVNPLAEEVLELVESLGAVVVTSAGNAATNVAFYSPENGNRVITVGAIGADLDLFPATNRGLLVDLVAPGGGPNTPASIPVAQRNVLSLRAQGTFLNDGPFVVADRYVRLAGTSMSSPHVAGAVALLRGLRPELEPGDVRRMMRLSARDLGAAGHDPEFGAGALDARSLVELARPAFALELTSPRVGALHDPATGPVVLTGSAGGADLAGLEVAVARGLAGRQFEPLAGFGRSKLEWLPTPVVSAFRAIWDTAGLTDGPYVLRVRARLRDGRVSDEHTQIGLERNRSLALSHATRPTSQAALSGRRLVWKLESNESAALEYDLVIADFPDSPPKNDESPGAIAAATERVIPLPGSQITPLREGRELAWLEPAGSGRRVAMRCRIESRRDDEVGCTPVSVSTNPGTFGPLFLARGWLVWGRSDRGQTFVEGCRLGRGDDGCSPRPLLDSASGSVIALHAFDGETVLVTHALGLARCRLAIDRGCVPEPISIASDDVPAEPRHAGDLLAFSRIEVENRRPPGCLERDVRPSCARQVVPVVEYRVCRIEAATSVCDPISVSARQVVDGVQGISVSGRRVAWAMADADEEAAIHVCELDWETRTCPDQRITGALALQSEAAIDGARVVWTDARDGATAIRGIELPDLAPARRIVRVAARGRRFAVPFEADAGSAPALRLDLEGVSGVPPQSASARVFDPGRPGGLVWILGTLPPSAPERSLWRLRAITPGGLTSTATLELVSGRP